MRRFSEFTRRVLRAGPVDLRSAAPATAELLRAAPQPPLARQSEARAQSSTRPFIPAQRNRRWATTF